MNEYPIYITLYEPPIAVISGCSEIEAKEIAELVKTFYYSEILNSTI